jgi:coenzyme F420-reducing hydrogenase gamma subunit
MSKVKVAFFDFTSCEGCQIELTNLGETVFMGLLDHIEIVEFRETMAERTTAPIDIAFIEGSFSRESDRPRLEEIRRRAAVVVAYGSCAAIGGINALKNHQPDYADFVYGPASLMPHLASEAVKPISDIIKVDYKIYGCPVSKAEFVRVVSDLLHGKTPTIPNYAVCVECKMRETVCRYALGDHCLGVVARAGCGAPCPADGVPCEACRGFIDHPNLPSLEKGLRDKGGLPADRAATKTRMWTAIYRSEA